MHPSVHRTIYNSEGSSLAVQRLGLHTSAAGGTGSRRPACPVSEVKVAWLCPTLCDPMVDTVHGTFLARILEWVAILFSRRIFTTHGSNRGLLHCRWILYQLSYQGIPNAIWNGQKTKKIGQ